MSKKTIYLAHPWVTRDTELEKELIKAAESKGYESYEPFSREDVLEEKYGGRYYEVTMKLKKPFAEDIVRVDMKAVEDCDEIVALLPYRFCISKNYCPVGAIVELCRAKEIGKHIIIISDRTSPFLMYLADEFYESIGDWLIEYDIRMKEGKTNVF